MLKDLVEWSDIDSRFTQLPDSSIKVVEGDECIRQSIQLILSTMRFERVRREIGTGLYNLLFEPLDDDTAEDMEDLIQLNLERYENRIRVRRIRVTPNPDQNYFKLELTYSILASREMKNLTTFMPAMGEF